MADGVRITLTRSEILHGAQAGCFRHVEDMKLGRVNAHGLKGHEQSWQIDIVGALGELALSKHLGCYWAGKGAFRDADVGTVQVRSSVLHTNSLILHREDCDDHVFWFVTGAAGEYRIRGWIYGRDGKHDAFWRDPGTGRPAFFVPSEVLNDPQRLPDG